MTHKTGIIWLGTYTASCSIALLVKGSSDGTVFLTGVLSWSLASVVFRFVNRCFGDLPDVYLTSRAGLGFSVASFLMLQPIIIGFFFLTGIEFIFFLIGGFFGGVLTDLALRVAARLTRHSSQIETEL